MTIAILIKYIHFISIFFVFGALFFEYQLLQTELPRKTVKKLSKVDGIYGLFSILTVAAGLTLWLGVGKPAEFYSQNGLVYLKLGLFTVVGLLSIIPTVYFTKNRKGDATEILQVPKRIKTVVLIELFIIITMPFWASLMANGISIF